MRAELKEHVSVTSIEDTGAIGRVTTSLGVLEAPVVIVCAGAGSRHLLESAGIECRTVATLEQVAYFRSMSPRNRGEADDLEPLPVVIERVGGSELAVFGLPSRAQGLYKLGIHHSGPEVDPSAEPLEPDDAFTERLVHAAVSVLRDVDPTPQLVERCLYDNTVDEDFVIDRVGRVVIGAGTSGHGFKFGPLLGSLLADLATANAPSVPLERFSVRRRAVAGA
jgi:sarcosine oxidase